MSLRSALSTISRAGKIGRIALAARRVAKAPEADRSAARQALVQLLADARGVPLKFGQLLGNLSNSEDFAELAKGVPPRPWKVMRPVLEQSLGRPIEFVFAHIDPTGIGASLGQVHRGTLHDGTEVAIKLRYPDIAEAVHSEMQIAGLLPGIGPVRKWGFDLSNYKQTLKSNMDRELDYHGEMQRQEHFRETVQVQGLVVPRVLPQWCSESVLIQSWEQGDHLDRAAQWPLADRLSLANTLLRTFFTSLFVHGEIHGDPHLGNLLVRRSTGARPQVVLLDFGCTVKVHKQAQRALLKLILGARSNDATDPLSCFVAMGFDAQKLEFVADVLPAMAKLLLEPFTSDVPFHLQHWHLNERMAQLLGEKRWWFRSAGPAEAFFTLRAFAGLIHQLAMLRVSVPWWNLLTESIGLAELEEARQYPIPSIRTASNHSHRFNGLAQSLRIKVTNAGEEVVSVSFPATQVIRLKELMPEAILEKLSAAQIDLDQIIRKACNRGIVPQSLFALVVENKTYQVWLE